RRLVRGGVGRVAEPGPRALVRVPPHVALALGPGLSVGVGGRAVVEDPRVLRPRPPPLARDPVLLGARPATRGLVHPVGVDSRMDPRAARRRAVGLEVVVAGAERAVGLTPAD